MTGHSYFTRIPLIIAVALLLLATEAPAPAAQAADFTVDSTADAVDVNPGDGLCDDGAGNCTLRAAVQEANALDGADTITLPAGIYTLTIAGTGEDDAATGDLDIFGDLTITGAGAEQTVVDGGGLDSVLHIDSRRIPDDISTTADISGITVRNGRTGIVAVDGAGEGVGVRLESVSIVRNSPGGGIWSGNGCEEVHVGMTIADSVIADNVTSDVGGGIYNGCDMTILNSTISGNEAYSGGGLAKRNIFASTTLTDVTISGNRATDAGGGISSAWRGGLMSLTNVTVSDNTAAKGGGISLGGMADLVATNTTISGNVATSGRGGGIHDSNADTMVLINVTIAANQAKEGGGIWFRSKEWPSLEGSIVAGNAGGDCGARSQEGDVSDGNNLDGDGTCGFRRPSDVVGADARLGPLADNGGFTQTHALLSGSPAIDAADNADCPDADQRGTARPIDGDSDGIAVCDIGAFEAPEGTTTSTPTPAPPSPTPAPTPPAGQLPAVGGDPGSGGDARTVAIAVLVMAALGLVGVGSALIGRWHRG